MSNQLTTINLPATIGSDELITELTELCSEISSVVAEPLTFEQAQELTAKYKRLITLTNKYEAKRKEVTKPLDDAKKGLMVAEKAATNIEKQSYEVIKAAYKAKYDELSEKAFDMLANGSREAVFNKSKSDFDHVEYQTLLSEIQRLGSFKVKEWHTENITKVPAEYLMLNQKAISEASAKGVIFPAECGLWGTTEFEPKL